MGLVLELTSPRDHSQHSADELMFDVKQASSNQHATRQLMFDVKQASPNQHTKRYLFILTTPFGSGFNEARGANTDYWRG